MKPLFIIVPVLFFVLFALWGCTERRECQYWASHPEEITAQWQVDQCNYHNITL